MAYGKIKMDKEKDLTDPGSLGKGDGRMYTGGTPNFNERTGKYRKPKLGGQENSIPVRQGETPVGPGDLLKPSPRRTIQPFPGPGMGIGQPTPIDMVGRRKRPVSRGQKPGLRTIQPVNPRKGMGY
jgi:hypothetical protein